MIARAVLIDMAKHFGVDSLAPGQAFGSSDIKAAMTAQKITVNEGDIVLFHTGYTDKMLEADPQTWGSTLPGITNEAAVFLAGLNPMAVGADTWGLEAVPLRQAIRFSTVMSRCSKKTVFTSSRR